MIQVSDDGGANWRKIEALPDVPHMFFVNDIKADRFDADTAYACVDNHKAGDFAPYVLKTTDRGRTWTNLSETLPERHVVWRLVQDHVDANLMFLGTEFGVYCTLDGGLNWIQLKGGLPTIPVRDLTIQERHNDLVLATFGRSFYVLDDYSALRGMTEESLAQEASLYGVRDALWYIQRRPLGGGKQASQGNAFFVADNPDFGAVFTYHLSEGYKTAKEARKKAEKESIKAGEDTPTPGWDALREEKLEEGASIVFVITDSEGNLVRTMDAPAGKGMHRVAWNLRRPGFGPFPRTKEEADFDDGDGGGAMVAPGVYTVTMHKRVAGHTTPLGQSQTFDVKPLGGGALSGASPSEVAAFRLELAQANGRASTLATLIKEGLQQTEAARWAAHRVARTDLDAMARLLHRQLLDMEIVLDGDPVRGMANDPGPRSIRSRLSNASMGTSFSTYGPTPTHRMSLDVATRAMDTMSATLTQIMEAQMPKLLSELQTAGAPWIPGQGLGK